MKSFKYAALLSLLLTVFTAAAQEPIKLPDIQVPTQKRPASQRVTFAPIKKQDGFRVILKGQFYYQREKGTGWNYAATFAVNGKKLTALTSDKKARLLRRGGAAEFHHVKPWSWWSERNGLLIFFRQKNGKLDKRVTAKTAAEGFLYSLDITDLVRSDKNNVLQITNGIRAVGRNAVLTDCLLMAEDMEVILVPETEVEKERTAIEDLPETLRAAAQPEPVLNFIAAKPVIDGKVSPAEWQGAYKATLKNTRIDSAKEKTEIYLARDDKNLYAAFVCYDRDIKNLKRMWQTPEERDNGIWSDDSVEIRFDPWNTPREIGLQRQIIINSHAVIYDAVGSNPMVDFNITTHAFVGSDRWSVEVAVPLEELTNYKIQNAELWRIMLSRHNPRTKDIYTLTGGASPSVAQPDHFLTFRSGKVDPKRPFTIVGFQRNNLLWRSEKGAGELKGTLEQLTIDLKKNAPAATSVLSRSKTQDTIPVKIQKNTQILRFSAPGNFLLEWTLPANRQRFATVKFTEKPLYKELWSSEPPGLGKDGAMTWNAGFTGYFLPIAMEFAIPWEEIKELQHASSYRLLLHGGPGIFSKKAYDWQNKTPEGTKFVGSTQYYNYWKLKVPKSKLTNRPLILDPAVESIWLRSAVNSFKPYAKHLYAMSFGDEFADWEARRFLDLAEQHRGKNSYPFLDKACLRIKNEYGHGKFGPPESNSDNNVYRWIAFRNFIADESLKLQKKLKNIYNKELPGVYIIGDDPMTSPGIFYDYTLFDNSVCDILNAQLYPASNANVSDFSFISKYIRDLANVKAMHPCFHIENYGAAFTPQEMLEKVSQAFRGGANGFHWYPSDVHGNRNRRSLGSERYGAPERWQLLTALQDEIQTLPPLKFPEADCGFFVPITTLRSYPGITQRPTKVQMLHSLLELQSGAWFKYFNERSLQENLVDLSKFKAVFIADSKYCSSQALAKLADYVKKGGTLVITDPEAFSFDSAASPLLRDMLPGLQGTRRRQLDKVLYGKSAALPLFKTATYELQNVKNAQVLLRYKDGRTAAQKCALGKGFVIVFGANFAQRELIGDHQWQKYFRALTGDLGIKLDQDIWRFRFPKELIKEIPRESGRCISGNHLEFRNFRADHSANEKVHPQASYTCTPAADAPAEPATVNFKQGKLFDRRRAYAQGNVDNRKSSLRDRVIGWKTSGPVTIEIDLKKPTSLDWVEIFATGALRDVTLYVSDGKSYRKAGFYAAGSDNLVKYGVRKQTLRLPATAVNTVKIKLEFAAAKYQGAIEKGTIPAIFNKPLLTTLPWREANFIISEINLFRNRN